MAELLLASALELLERESAAEELERAVRENFHKLMGNQSKIAARAAGRAVDVSADDFDDSDE